MNDSLKHQKYSESLTTEEKILIGFRDKLYGGSWERMLKDLNDRLKGHPYIFKLVSRIKDDIKRIEKLRGYEEQHGINLNDSLGTAPDSPLDFSG